MNPIFLSDSEIKYLERLLETRLKSVRTYRRPLVSLTEKLHKVKASKHFRGSLNANSITTKIRGNE